MNEKMEKSFLEYYGAKSKFVYYNSLEQTHPNIYKRIVNEKTYHAESHVSKMSSIADTMMQMASIEGAKEVALLKKFFNVNAPDLSPVDLYDKNIGDQIVNAINTALQFRDTYKRYLTRIVGQNGKRHAKITAAQFFAQYFTDNFYTIANQTLNSLGDITDYSPQQLADILFSDENINQALSNAFFGTEKSLKVSGDWSARDENHGYEELFSAIEKFNKETFLEEVANAYKLSELKERLMETIKSTDEIKSIFSGKKGAKSYIKKSLKESTTAKGTLAEILGEKAAAAVVEAMGGGSSFSSKVIGKAGGKADIVMTFNMDMSKILDVVDKHYNGRQETVEAYKSLNDYLSKMDDGFIVYVNAKDYSLIEDKGNGSYFFQGFSAGSPISLGTFEGVIYNTPGGSQEIIGQIMSTMEGATWEDRKGDLEQELCSKMAYLLFDDVLTIGKPTAASNRAIHLTLLDGIYIPLSYLFYIMANAIKSVSEDPDDIFNIDIESGKIAYPNPPWTPGMWREQASIAKEQIKISATFLSNFVDVISGLKAQF